MALPAGSGLNTFVGRRRELDVLGRLLDRAQAGQGGVALLVGAPGIGKTRTARELATVAVRRGAQVLWGRCFEGESPRPYGPWAEALGAYARMAGPDLLGE